MTPAILDKLVAAALAEDVGPGDITTTAVVPPGTRATALIITRQHGVLSGAIVASRVFHQVDPTLTITLPHAEGAPIAAEDVVLKIEGCAQALLTAERTALNFMQRMSGIATTTAQYVEACQGTRARIVDTRKTPPGLRAIDKYAVRAGGGFNHRVGLFDGVLIKENHIRAGGGIAAAVAAARAAAPHTLRIEIECETLKQVPEAIEAGADIILLDNMSTADIAAAVAVTRGRALLEASGCMTLERIPEVAATGVDFISVGALTHSVKALDLSLQIVDWHIPGLTAV